VVQSTPQLESLKQNPQLDVRIVDDTSGTRLLKTAKIALLVLPGSNGDVVYRFDDTRPEGLTARRVVDDALQRGAGRTDPVSIHQELVREPGARYIDFLVPGLLGMNLMASGIWGIGFTVVDQRRKKLLKRLVATPMSRAEYLASFMLARLSLLVVEIGILVGFGVLAFGVPLRGPLIVLALVCLLGSLSFGGLGLLIAARPKTIEGASGLMNLTMLPMWVFSGVFFSSSNFPAAMQPFIKALPLTAVNDALRANMLEGAGLTQVMPEIAVIAAWLVLCFVVALRVFRWQ
jgi:ABC-type multidrug transport system permease subunit